MPPTLPLELIELIVSQYSGQRGCAQTLKSLCLTCKALFPFSQQLLWLSIHLYFDKDPSSDAHRRSMLLARRIAFKTPRFGTYVRSLTFQLEQDAELPAKTHVVSRAIAKMANIVEFKIVHGNFGSDYPMPFGVHQEEWEQSFCDILCSDKLRSLTLWRVSRVPANALANALRNITELDMQGCSLALMSTPGPVATIDATTTLDDLHRYTGRCVSPLQNLTCDFVSYCNLQAIVDFFKFDEESRPGLNLAHLKSFDLTLDSSDETPRISYAILGHAIALDSMEVRNFKRSADNSVPVYSLLLDLNPSSYTALAKISFTLDNGPITEVTDPYMGLCAILHDLVKLRCIHLDLNFIGPMGSSQWEPALRSPNWASAWGTLDSMSDRLEELVEVKILVKIKPLWKRTQVARKKNNITAQATMVFISTEVYSEQFSRLSKRRADGRINFEFSVKV
ncbi:hypothetical protein NMY22_g3983 [Coprinellus aureogranulatus]|nr:hypothetical protein NMY22_g3983 [Coprinellus aureogranulatus]